MKFRNLIVLSVLLAAGTALAEGATKLAYVDLQRALNESEAGKKAKELFKGEVDKFEASLKKKKEAVEALKEQLEKKGSVMKDDERANLEDEYRKKMRDFELDYKDSQAGLQRKDNELTAAILKELALIIREKGERDGYTMIFEASSNAVLYGAKEIDLTEEVLQEYNRRHKK
jgi:outer membrane protein